MLFVPLGDGLHGKSLAGRVAFRFHTRDLHLVMGPADAQAPVQFKVLIDGQPPGPFHGTDMMSKATARSANSAFTS